MQTIPQCADKCGAAIVVVVEGATARPRRCNAGSRQRRWARRWSLRWSVTAEA
ncbi:hypothetical protein DEO72_LG8g1308 [Vigna unguiculata]|uniref:Uncharacterized protein n=1 Tax=Vigna unguiculata TaxID=3917 RepID=A0A4D6MRA3_VIGUN|nr:hypothetical protein DEO72_LG8g1308 [Vigna unguiculata]